jgi:5'-nucleotidase
VSAANALREQGADAIIVIAHMGGRCADVSNPNDARSCEPDHEVMRYLAELPPGTIDVYFAGHTHSQMRQFIKGVGVVQAWPYSSDFSTVDLWVDRDANRVVSDRTQLRPPTMICTGVYTGTERCDPSRAPKGATLVPRTFEGRLMVPDQSIAAVVQPFLERVAAKRNERLGINTAAAFTRNSRAESSLGDIFADSMREAFATNFAFMNSGGLRQNLRAGELTYSDVFEVSPFDNYPAVVTLTGAQLNEILRITSTGDRGLQQVSGLRYTIDAAKDADKPVAERNRLITVAASDGSAIDPAALYTVVMPDFMVYGGEGIGAVMKAVPADRIKVWQDKTMRDVFAEMLKKRSQPIRPLTDGRITVLNAKPATGE